MSNPIRRRLRARRAVLPAPPADAWRQNDQRILFLDKGMFYGVTQVELPLRQIDTISYKTGLLYGELRLATGSGKSIVKKIRKGEVAKISSLVSSPCPQMRIRPRLRRRPRPH
jgi:hypothetical protein